MHGLLYRIQNKEENKKVGGRKLDVSLSGVWPQHRILNTKDRPEEGDRRGERLVDNRETVWLFSSVLISL